MRLTSILIAVLAVTVGSEPGSAQWFSDYSAPTTVTVSPRYTVRYQTVYERQPVTTYRLETKTVYVKEKVTTLKPVWETEHRERRYTVKRAVPETAEREEKYTVMRPVQETSYRDESYYRVRYETTTEMREQRRTVYRPVVETEEREQRVVVQRPVTETAAYDEVATQWTPVTSYRPQITDQGGYLDQWSFSPARQRSRLRWLGRDEYVNPVTGRTETQRPGLYWVPQPARGTYEVQRVYVPNYVTQAVPETTYMPQQVTRRVEVPVTTYRDEVEVRKVPVQVTRMVAQEEVRRMPVSVETPIRELVERKVPVVSTRWVEQEVVRKVPVTTYKIVQEERVEPFEVKVCRMETIEREVVVPRTERHWVAYQSEQLVPRQVAVQDGCSAVDPWNATYPSTIIPGPYDATAVPSSSDSAVQQRNKPAAASPESADNGSAQDPTADADTVAPALNAAQGDSATGPETDALEAPPAAPVAAPLDRGQQPARRP